MKEKIKELAEQAGATDEGLEELKKFIDLECFAELVRQDERALANPDLSIEANRVAYDVAMYYANKTKEKLG